MKAQGNPLLYVLSTILSLTTMLRCVTSQFPTAAENVSEVLDRLLQNYRKELRPGFGGEPLHIETDMLIRSIGQISESNMDYSFQCYFRQRWYDKRLTFRIQNVTEVTLNNLFLFHIWKPNTYFLNGQRSHQHNITVPNLFVRIREDGRIYLSRRLTIKAACPMALNTYPMDHPACPLVFGSYGFTTDDIIYSWKYGNDKSVEVHADVRMSQFDLKFVRARNSTENTLFGTYSTLELFIYFERHIGFYVLQTYLPCSLITGLSWVSFWINRDAAPARVLLGVTTILASAGIGMTVREGLPRVSYATALDVYLNVCIMYELAAMIEYAAVNYFTKVMPLEGGTDEDEEDEEEQREDKEKESRATLLPVSIEVPFVGITDVTANHVSYPHAPTARPVQRRHDSCPAMFLRCLSGNLKYRSKLRESGNKETGNSVSDIDIWCRYLFPGSFLLFNLVYWAFYLGNW